MGKDGRIGAATANLKHLASARQGRNKILAGDCFSVVGEKDAIVDQMTVPLVQGMLKYAFKSDPKNELGDCFGDKADTDKCDKAWAEGWAFAAAVLPRLHYCNTGVADMVKKNLDVGGETPSPDQMKDGYKKLKAEVESVYACLGITCADIGEFQDSAGVKAGLAACGDGSEVQAFKPTEKPTAAPKTDESVAGAFAFAMLFLNAQI